MRNKLGVYWLIKALAPDKYMKEKTPTLGELLRLSYPHNLEWTNNEIIPELQVNWVVTSINDLQNGDILLIRDVDLNSLIVQQTQEAGGVALILVGDKYAKQFSPDPVFPIISLPGENNLREVHYTLLNILINRRVYLMERGVRIQAMLSKLAAEGEGLVGIIRAMSDLSGRGIVLQDKRLAILAEHPSSSLISIWGDILEQIMGIESLPDGFADRKKTGKSTTILRQEIGDELGRIVTPVTVGGVARGYLSFIDVDNDMDALDLLIAEQGALVCAIEMSRIKAVREAEKRLKGDLLTALLQENITPRDANLWVQSIGFDLGKRHVALRFSWDAQTPPSMRRLETLVNGEVTKREVKALVEALGSEIVCICQVDANTGRPKAPLALANAVADLAQQEFPDIPVRCGIGSPAEDLSLWRDSFRQAGQALELARRLDERNPQYFPDLSVYRLLLQLEHFPDLQAFKNEILGPLISYEGGGDLINTLEAYFDHNGVLSQAAEALYIHRNTLIYRMERIAEISGLDLDNTETRLAVQLALRIHRMSPKI